ncbi:conserved Plasmodium protein, unknown function [Plasmodium gallinaceum]|uniref:Uncharacterized protein n=1 Tax=Plasmodium gallinaceum TaxID=5849 RepID=A0A1J1GMQ6_PLAGA|nr:conserved Plasmodium protein, unknown function [Plasmodium gallinaceum]CRG93619.1 conserved Plasmodium protein, unknown function [Plasmodium gallinaceum]
MIIEEKEKKNITNDENEITSSINLKNEISLYNNIEEFKESNDNIQKCFESLNNTIENMNVHVNNILKDNEEKYILAFNTYMYDVQKEIRILKKILKEEKIKELKDEKMKKLQKELKWYINECLRLDNISQYLKKEAEKWKRNSSLMKSHMLFLEKKLTKTFDKVIEKKNVKIEEEKKLENENIENKKDIFSEKKNLEQIEKEDENKNENKLKDKRKKDNLNEEMNLKITNLEKKLKKQININSNLQEKLTKYYIEKSKYEKLFIDCVKQIKKDIENKTMINEKEKYIEENFSSLIDESELSYFTKEDKKKLLITFFSSNDLIQFIRKKIFSQEKKMPLDIYKKNSYTNPRMNYQKKSDISPFIL